MAGPCRPRTERGALNAARPFSRAVLDVALPDDDAIADVTGVVRGVLAMGDVLRDAERVSVRLVMTPERLAVDEARRTFTYLNLYGFPVDAVVVNRVFPAEVGDYFDGWRERQEEELRGRGGGVRPRPGAARAVLRRGGPRPGDARPAGERRLWRPRPRRDPPHGAAERLELSAEDAARLHLPLPLAERGDVSLRQVGGEPVVRVDGYKRTLLLPPALQGWSARGAALADGALTVDLEAPDSGDRRSARRAARARRRGPGPAEALAEETAAIREDDARTAARRRGRWARSRRSHRPSARCCPEDLWEQVWDLVRGLLILVRALLDR